MLTRTWKAQDVEVRIMSSIKDLGEALLDFEARLNDTRGKLDDVANDLLVLAEELVMEIRNEAIVATKLAKDRIRESLEKESEFLTLVYKQRIEDDKKKIKERADSKFTEAVEEVLNIIRGAAA